MHQPNPTNKPPDGASHTDKVLPAEIPKREGKKKKVMATKRSLDDEDDAEHQPPPPSMKRARRDQPSSKQRHHQNAHMDPTWGQKFFFTHDLSSSVPQDDELEFEDDADAMAYLRSVRQQAGSIPHLLVAPKIGPQLPPSYQRALVHDEDDNEDGEIDESADRTVYGNGVGDFRGYYQDGAYTAAPFKPQEYLSEGEYASGEEEDREGRDPSAAAAEAYFSSIRSRFLSLRSHLQTSPPERIVAALPESHSPYVGPFGPRSSTFTQWNKRIQNTDPLPAQVASMDKDSVIRVLRVVMGGRFLRVGREVSERTSRWLWALLARLPHVGELSHTEVAWVRDLGRRAVLLGRSIAEMAALRDELAGGGGDLGLNDAVDESEEDEDVVQEFEGEDNYSEDEESKTEGTDAPGKETPSGAVAGPSEEASPENGQKRVTGRVGAEGEKEGKEEEKQEEKEQEEVDEQEEGEASEGDDDDAPMDLDESGAEEDDLEAAKRRLLARLDRSGGESESGSPNKLEEEDGYRVQEEEDSDEALRARMNMRATINMILTVAGEFYGQRDLLEFRDPFAGM